MKHYLCIHAHFYQPPRENPWLEEVELQETAYPYHDWNERVTSECYAPNTAARILNAEQKIVDIVNHYTKISFNFGPTLLSWLKRHKPEVYQKIIESDKESQKKFSGHGAALAQCYSHMIMPLAHRRDKKTQVIWGLRDFEKRFKRKAKGMWLPETAVDLETLDILAEEGIQFTILAPHQARRVRNIHEAEWTDVSGGRIDPRRPYRCQLPSGRNIAVFFYDGPISQDIAFGKLLADGEAFAQRLRGTFSKEADGGELVHIATDGETYGHHQKYGEMALAYCLRRMESFEDTEITIYSRFLEQFPPAHEVEIYEHSSWSCLHGVERWCDHCGCQSGTHPGWHQRWRKPLREAMDWLRDQLQEIYQKEMLSFCSDPWAARNDYIEVVLDRSQDNINRFLSRHTKKKLTKEEKIKVFKLLEIERHAMLMYTSCGWFFDDISGIETIQILRYAARAIQLAHEAGGCSLEGTFVDFLGRAPSNVPKYENGAHIYRKFVKPAMLDLVRVGVHYAMSSLYEEYADVTPIYCYKIQNQFYDRMELGRQKLAVGRALICSDITFEEKAISFAVLHFGDHNMIGGVSESAQESKLTKIHQKLKDVFRKDNIRGTVRLIKRNFDLGPYSLRHLFKDEQSKILYQILDSSLVDIESSLRDINEHHYPIIQIIKQLHIPLPKVLMHTISVMLNTDLLRVVGDKTVDFKRLRELVAEVEEWSLEVDKTTLGFFASRKINQRMEEFKKSGGQKKILEEMDMLLRVLAPLNLPLDLGKAQNIYFSIAKEIYPAFKAKAQKDHDRARVWTEHFEQLGDHLQIKIKSDSGEKSL